MYVLAISRAIGKQRSVTVFRGVDTVPDKSINYCYAHCNQLLNWIPVKFKLEPVGHRSGGTVDAGTVKLLVRSIASKRNAVNFKNILKH